MASRVRLVGAAILFVICLLAAGCSSGEKEVVQTGLMFTAPGTSAAVDAGQMVNITVNQPVTWALQADGNIQGQLTNQTTTSATYVAPAVSALTGPIQVSVVATLTSDTTQSAILPINVNLPVSLGGTISANTSCTYDLLVPNGNSSNATVNTYRTGATNPQAAKNGSGPFAWTVSTGSLPPGLYLTPNQSTNQVILAGTPTSVGCYQFSLEVTDSAGLTATSSSYYFIVTPQNLALSYPNLPSAYAGVAFPPFAVTISGGTPPYQNWQGDPENFVPGVTSGLDAKNSSVAIISGTPIVTPGTSMSPDFVVEDSQQPYHAVGFSTITFNFPFDLPANSCMPAQGGPATTTNLANLNGSYAFLMRGFDNDGPVVLAGSFTADGMGNITAGVEDVMRKNGAQVGVSITSGSYQLIQQNDAGTDTFVQSGCLILTTSSGTTTFSLSMGGCSTGSDLDNGTCNADSQGNPGLYMTGRLMESDDTTGVGTRGTGIVRLQDSSVFAAGLNGTYAFGLAGWDASGGRLAAAGSFTAGSGSLSAVAADVNDAGTLQSNLTGGNGTFSALDSTTGRGTASWSAGSAMFNNLVVYAVSSTEAIVASTGALGTGNPALSGEAIGTTGPFVLGSLQNSHIFHAEGISGGQPDVNIGILQFDGLGSFTGTQYEDQAATLSTTALSGTYGINAGSGRFALLAPSLGQNAGDHPFVGYVIPVPSNLTRQSCVKLSSCVTAFLVSTDATTQSGILEFQTPTLGPPPPFNNTYVAGYYFFGSDEGLDPSTPYLNGTVKTNPTTKGYNGIESASYPDDSYCYEGGTQLNCAVVIPNQMLTGGYSISSNGSGNVGGQTVAVTNGNVIFYISESPLDAHPAVIVVEQ